METRRITASEQIYKEMYSQIIFLEIKPGEDLNMKKLLDNTKVSRSPLRDALLKLQEDNLVEIYPQKGSCVTKINLHYVEMERFMRATLELAAIPLFAPKCTKELSLKMKSAIEAQRIAKEGENKKDFLLADDEFHRIIFAGLNMERLWTIMQGQTGNYQRIRVLTSFVPEIMETIIAEHEEILAALSNNDTDKALLLEKEHLGKLRTEIDILESKYGKYFDSEIK